LQYCLSSQLEDPPVNGGAFEVFFKLLIKSDYFRDMKPASVLEVGFQLIYM